MSHTLVLTYSCSVSLTILWASTRWFIWLQLWCLAYRRNRRMGAMKSTEGRFTVTRAHSFQAETRGVSIERLLGTGKVTSGGSNLVLLWRWLSSLMRMSIRFRTWESLEYAWAWDRLLTEEKWRGLRETGIPQGTLQLVTLWGSSGVEWLSEVIFSWLCIECVDQVTHPGTDAR